TTLVKLNRPEEAVEAFGPGVAPGQDALLDYYRAIACYDAHLFHCADALLASVGSRAGPRIAAIAADVRAKVAAALATEPSRESIDWYLARCAAERASKRKVLAAAYCREASSLSKRRSDRYKLAESEAETRG
ncbi:MAG TPA: hypothetical protein VFM53_12735, partial [Anaeromyxobacteraceae bacterium]|nr:hypothetical protein [Anaeromyxobacteraceae bacterium]